MKFNFKLLTRFNSILFSHLILTSFNLFFKKIFKKIIITYKIRAHKDIDISLPSNYIYPSLVFLKLDTSSFNSTLIDLIMIDYPTKPNRFFLIYSLLLINNLRIHINTSLNEFSSVLSITSLFRSSIWSEREVFDFFGVYFIYNKDLRRILTNYGFKGHPLRKDFPLSGFVESYYDDNEKRIVLKKTEFTQDFKNFTFKSKWL